MSAVEATNGYHRIRDLPSMESVIGELYRMAGVTPDTHRVEVLSLGDMAFANDTTRAFTDNSDDTTTITYTQAGTYAGVNKIRIRDEAPIEAAAIVGFQNVDLGALLKFVRVIESENIEKVLVDGPTITHAKDGLYLFEEPVFLSKTAIKDELVDFDVAIMTANVTSRSRPIILALRKRT